MAVTGETYTEQDGSNHRYELSQEEMARFTANLLREREPVSDDRFVCYEINASDPDQENYADIGRTIEREVFERRFEGNDTEGMQEGYRLYEDQSIFFLSVDTETGQPAGVIRVIRDGANGFKTLEDLAGPKYKDDPGFAERVYAAHSIDTTAECWDIATAAVRKGYGGGEVSSQVYRAMWVASQRDEIKHFFSIIDKKPYEMMQFLGFPFDDLAEDTGWMEYEGSAESLPVYGYASEFAESVRRQFEGLEDSEFKTRVEPFFRTLGYGDGDESINFLQNRQTDNDLDFAA
jgi:hypothetical protein